MINLINLNINALWTIFQSVIFLEIGITYGFLKKQL